MMLLSKRFRLSRLKMLAFLGELEVIENTARSLYVPCGVPLTEIGNWLAQIPDTEAVSNLAELITASKTGAVLFWGSSRRCLVLPPFPITERYSARGYDVEPLRSLLKRDFVVALILVRLGAFAIGVAQGDRVIDSKVGTGLVHARHKKGGSSQGRFARHREKQIEYFLERVCRHAREKLEPHARALDYVVYGGSRSAILSLRKQCPFFSQFDNRILLLPLLDIPKPRRAVLEEAAGHVWSSSVVEWYDEEVLA